MDDFTELYDQALADTTLQIAMNGSTVETLVLPEGFVVERSGQSALRTTYGGVVRTLLLDPSPADVESFTALWEMHSERVRSEGGSTTTDEGDWRFSDSSVETLAIVGEPIYTGNIDVLNKLPFPEPRKLKLDEDADVNEELDQEVTAMVHEEVGSTSAAAAAVAVPTPTPTAPVARAPAPTTARAPAARANRQEYMREYMAERRRREREELDAAERERALAQRRPGNAERQQRKRRRDRGEDDDEN